MYSLQSSVWPHLSHSACSSDHSLRVNTASSGSHVLWVPAFPSNSSLLPLSITLPLHLTCKCGSAQHTAALSTICHLGRSTQLVALVTTCALATFELHLLPRFLWTPHLTSPSRCPSNTSTWMRLELSSWFSLSSQNFSSSRGFYHRPSRSNYIPWSYAP